MAVADLFDHLHIKQRPLVHALGFEQTSLVLEQRFPVFQFGLDGRDGGLDTRARHDEVTLRINGESVIGFDDVSGKRIERGQLVDVNRKYNADDSIAQRLSPSSNPLNPTAVTPATDPDFLRLANALPDP